MKTIGFFIIALLVVGALAFWIRTQVGFPEVQSPNLQALMQGQPASVATGAANAGEAYVDITGTILLDTSTGISVPYILYAAEDGKPMTKQLVYAGSRGCAAYAGDLPCVSIDQDAAYPQLPTGTTVRVRGLHKEDRILVYQIDAIRP